MLIRNATNDDLLFLVNGVRETRTISGFPKENINKPTDKEDYKKAIKEKKIRVVETDNELAGFIYFKTDFEVMYLKDFFFVDIIYVAEKFRNKGVGKVLYDDVIKIAKKKGFKKIVIDVFDVNNSSVSFHKKIGFVPIYTIYEKHI